MKRVQLYGERCSGTKWATKLITHNFNITTGPYLDPYGWKHWFIKDTTFDKIKNDNKTLFVVIFRNPYQWMKSLHKTPHHLKSIKGKPFIEFIKQSPLISKEIKFDFKEESENLLTLRTEKILNFKKLQEVTDNVLFFKYEDLLVKHLDYLNKLQVAGLEKQIKPINCIKKAPQEYKLLKAEINHINEHLNWDVENDIGYEKFYKICYGK